METGYSAQGTSDLHESPLKVEWPGTGTATEEIDWSTLGKRPLIFHPEHDSSKEKTQ